MKPAPTSSRPENGNTSNIDDAGTANQLTSGRIVKVPTVPHQPPYLPPGVPPSQQAISDGKHPDPSRKPIQWKQPQSYLDATGQPNQPPRQRPPPHRPGVGPFSAPPKVPQPGERPFYAGPSGQPPHGAPPRPTDRAASGMQVDSFGPGAQGPRPAQPRGPGPVVPPLPRGQAPPPQGGGGMRELRVEDALVYLDDVKREFGDRPSIYNEFLEIMKNFKSQEVDTPGVINRVSRLFRGYNNLILGFNKFLPDGYKISLEDLERRDAEYARQQELEGNEALSPKAPEAGQGKDESKHTQHAPHSQAAGPHYRPPNVAPTQPGPPGPPRSQMKDGSPVRKASQGQPLPMSSQPYQNRMPQLPPGPHAGQHMVRQNHQSQSNGSAQPDQNHKPGLPQHPQLQRMPQGASPHQPRPQPRPEKKNPQQPLQQAPQQAQPAAQPQHQAVEFDHAISYVTNIKKRFADDPNTYHQFLEILHTYQKEQRGIKEVLEQVASLFQDHPDLLKEFTFFLPDAVQDQAKKRLNKAAEESEARQALAAQQRGEEHGNYGTRPNWGGPRGLENRPRLSSQKFIDMTDAQKTGSSDATEQVQAQGRPTPPTRKRSFSPGRETQKHRPETYVFNSAVERQFFEAAKEALISFSRDGGQGWAQFVKSLDLYGQEHLSKSEMLTFVEPLLGKRNSELFEEFKRILSAAGSPNGSTPSTEDSWYSVPLSEIDFFRCRQCTPSYRALPRDYPAPPCSDRSDEEKRVLNDLWVSLPKGSEESYTFRHMRRNHCEEVLFRCEDERFEIDMAIDSNDSTLRRLEPIAEEIAQLSQGERLFSEFTGSDINRQTDEYGMGELRFQYTFDPSILGVIHRNSITRIYGDAGQEMLELIEKNPSVAIPTIVQRLEQKAIEWKATRDRLNRHWKELAEMNYYKSLDHRSLTWRTTDKRATSTRTLVSEIKDRAANDGKESEASFAARRDKAKEEHGSFFEVTMGNSLSQDLDLTYLPKPDPSIFIPHMSLKYENNSWVQRDAYRILSFALERGSISPADKERCHRLWRDLFGPLFGIPLGWMQQPAVSYQDSTSRPSNTEFPAIVSNGEDNSHDDEDESEDDELGSNVVTEEPPDNKIKHGDLYLSDHHPLPAGTLVSTLYGEGRIVRFRGSDKCYEVDLAYGTGFLRPKTVLSTIQRTEQSAYTNQLRADDGTRLERKDDFLCFGTQSLYLFFRLHQILIRRLNIAKEMAYKVNNDASLATLVEQMKSEPNEDVGRKRYDTYLSLVYMLLDGGHSDAGGKYEDRARYLLGHGGYELATMDKLISHILKNLQSMAHDEVMMNLVSLFRRHYEKGFRPESFKQEAAYLSEGDNMYAFQLCRIPDSDDKVLHLEFLGVIYEDDDQSQNLIEHEPEPAPKRPRVR
eukprot:CAMPEP_0194206976 /NCGR_PEP_ID=MMETSP0156-20130528/5864_1 /TAXON_ID=33649 /ORGANISM="Thalassionema nitzschioides, Strain L26-B" /LENGTH=1392 /DNA_ID=CAMNT_0038933643 /DNA_START=271 /DNA_END=4449 /DNA_ORIENTATION=-